MKTRRGYSFKIVIRLLLDVVLLSLPVSVAHAGWETLVDGTSFNNVSAFENKWAYNYPWGTDHNGSARMNQTNVTVSEGMVTLTSSPTKGHEGKSAKHPNLAIRYDSGTFYLKQQITISRQFPVWDISGEFKAPTQPGTWPAFWLTGANSWPPESDIAEFKSGDLCWQNTYDGSWQNQTTLVTTASSVWHSYRLVATLRNSKTVDFRYYIDGEMKSDQAAGTFVDSPCWLVVDYQMKKRGASGTPDYATYFCASNIVVKCQAGPLPPTSHLKRQLQAAGE